ncbi:mercuric reductase [Legionella lansingensis]|uniref:Mercuric reductase n=1 Tax=Legionella lansingensis TaxID=45067 RepID=A0A0W0VXS4_9GAMM|nr:FAD-dependent oxidoreductase [Legionella lansingensis]KTD24754.1 hypothetical protein Llan_0316 [Legionella lansingensis]SNV48813.1 mercuric reductase [Legionella lansingensis]
MNQTIRFDLAIIGAGPGGLSLASGASQLGLNVVLIESNKMGGDCLNTGCVPSKSLLAAAKSIYQARHQARYFGAEGSLKTINFHQVMSHVSRVIETIAEHDSVERFESLGVQVIRGHAQFLSPDTLQAGDVRIKAKRFVIATGSIPFVPPIQGIESIPYETNETIFNLQTLPKHLMVIGGGPIGCELAQAFAMLGSEVSIIEAMTILPKDDRDCVAIVKHQLEETGVRFYEQSQVNLIANLKSGIDVQIETPKGVCTLTGSHVLVATGRRPNIAQLDLDKAGVRYSAKGIEVNARLQTTNKHIYAIGDVASPYQFTHMASYHAGIVLRNIVFKLPAKINHQAIPWVTYTYPELAHVGKTDSEVNDDTNYQTTEWLFKDNDRAQTEKETLGKIKIVTNKKGRIVAATIVGAHAGELILPWVIAVRESKSLRSFTDVIVPYPTLSEVSKQVAGEFYKPKLFSNTTRRLVFWLQKLWW